MVVELGLDHRWTCSVGQREADLGVSVVGLGVGMGVGLECEAALGVRCELEAALGMGHELAAELVQHLGRFPGSRAE